MHREVLFTFTIGYIRVNIIENGAGVLGLDNFLGILFMAQVRLQRVLAAAGVDSRRKCEQLILDGAVRVNRKIVNSLPAFVDPDVDIITVNGKRIRPQLQKVYFLLNKPKGVICTNSDPQGRKKAIDLIRTKQRVYCVGRLDIDTTGLIIITNDNQLTNRLTHPSFKISKTYVAVVKGRITPTQVEKLKKGVWLDKGKTAGSSVKVLKKTRDESIIEITIRQGMNRQVRRMLAKVELAVKSLKRTRIGKIDSKGIGVGKYRELSKSQIEYLKRATSPS